MNLDAMPHSESTGPGVAGAALDLCLASLHFYPVYAGPAVRFRRYAPGLRRRDIQMRVFTASPREEGSRVSDADEDTGQHQRPNDQQAPMARLDRVDDIPVHRVRLTHRRGTKRGWWEYQRRLLELCRTPHSRPEVVQLLTVDPWSTYYLNRMRDAGIPLVYTHTMLSSMSERWWKRQLQRLYWPLPYRFLDCTVVSSTVMRDALRQIGVSGRIEVIPNGTNMQQFRPASPDEKARHREELNLPSDDPIVLFVGSMSPRKGVDVLLEAWRQVRRHHRTARLVLVGPRHDEIRPDEEVHDFSSRVDQVVKKGEASTGVTFTGAVETVEEYYRAADIFVFPSRKEGMPNVVPEAYACGLPVVMTPFQGLPEEFGRPGAHHLLVDWRPDEIADALVGLLASPERRHELGTRARIWAERELALETALDRYASLYWELREQSRVTR